MMVPDWSRRNSMMVS